MASPAKTKKRRKRLSSYPAYIMSDIKKCGLTFPRRLFKVVGEELNRLHIDCGDEIISLAEAPVYYAGQRYDPIRGSGLGNLNEVVTLIQCIWGEMLCHVGLIGNALFFNDDGVLCLDKSDNLALPKILSFYAKFGMIMNIEKSFFSKYNIFCEDYNSGDYDFSKRHLRVLQITTLLEQEFLWEQKKVFSSIIKDLDIFNEGKFTKENRFEFHKFESILPLAFGGWKNTSRGGINILLDYIFEPSKYLLVEELSLVPLMNKWITFIFENRDEFFELFYEHKKFPYRSKVKNPFNDTYLDLSLYDLENLPDFVKKNRYTAFERLYNERGLKNAKPKLKSNFAYYLQKRRLGFFARFWREKNFLNRSIYPDIQGLLAVLEFLRGEDNLSRNLAPPEFIGEGKTMPVIKSHRNVIISRASGFTEESDERRVNTIITHRDDKLFFPNLSIRPLTALIEPKGESYFSLPNGVTIVEGRVPRYYSLFFRDKRYFATIYYNLYGRYPDHWLKDDLNLLDLSKYRGNIFSQRVSARAGKLVSSLTTAREEKIFHFMTEGLILKDVNMLEICVTAVKDLIASWRYEKYDISDQFSAFLDDEDFVYEEFPELAIQFLVDEYDDIYESDESPTDFDYDEDYDFRNDIYDVISDI
jgi:hypothetical protein